jgi:hypothetical protein
MGMKIISVRPDCQQQEEGWLTFDFFQVKHYQKAAGHIPGGLRDQCHATIIR